MRHLLLILILAIFSTSVVEAGIVKGVIIEKATGETAVGASVTIKDNSSYNTIAGLDGSFKIENIPPGTYTLQITYINAAPFEQSITVAESDPLILQITLPAAKTNQIAEVIIGEKRDGGSEQTARNIEQKADQIVNIVSAKAIQISPDITVANVIQRVSGVSIERNSNGDGQFAILRGMDKRYNYTMVNGVKIPSPDNKYRYVPLDIFPAELLDRLEVYKSLTPDMEGDAIGGAVNMVMKDAPSRFSFSANLATGYSELFFQRDFQSFDKGGINSKSPYELNGKTYNATPADFPTAPLDYTLKKPMPNLIGGLSIGNRYLNDKLGIILAGSYQNTYRGANSQFFNHEVVDTFSGVTLTKNNLRNFSEQQQRAGVHAKIDYKFNDRNKLKWYSAYLSLTNVQLRDQITQQLFDGGYDAEKGNATLTYSTRSRLTEQKISAHTLQGEHQLSDKLKVDWSGVYSKATNARPDNTTIDLNGTEQNFVETITTANDMSRRWEHNTDRDFSGYLNFTFRQPVAGLPIEWKAGGLYRNKKRDNFYNNYTFSPKNRDTFGIQFTEYNQIDWNLNNPRGSVGSAANYKAHEYITAGYLQFKINVEKWEVISGARAEHTNQGYEMYQQIGEDNPVDSQIYTDILPSLNIKYKLRENTNLRASYFKSVNRPGFFELVPVKIVEEDYQERGNFNLKHAIADNLDIKYETFPHAGEALMLGAFYKRIQDPIEFTLQADPTRGQDIYYGPNNFGTAHNFGLELDFIKYFNKIGFKGNYTYTHSSITTPKSQRVRDDDGLHLIYPEQTRPLYGQAAHIANLSILYKDIKNGWDAQLAGNYTGTRIVTVAQFIDRDIWQKAFIQMDFSVEKTFKNRIAIFAKVNNLLNTPMETFIKGQTEKNQTIPDQDLKANTLIQRDYYQRSYLLGLRYKI